MKNRRPIVAPGCFDAQGRFTRPIGSGPFKSVSRSKDRETVLVKNSDYWGGPPSIDKVVFKIIPDAVTRIIALESGDVDMIVKVPEPDVERLRRTEGISVHRTLTTFTEFIQFFCD